METIITGKTRESPQARKLQNCGNDGAYPRLEIKVTNLWVNRLVGDRQPDERNQITFTTSVPYTADTPLKPSGLLGPVTIMKYAQTNNKKSNQ